MISFVWPTGEHLPAGTGGSENYTAGHVRELNRRGVPAQVVTVGMGGAADGRDEFTDVPFLTLPHLSDVATLPGTVVFVNGAALVPTARQSFQILHNPPPIRERYRAAAIASTRDRVLIATSRYAAGTWAAFLGIAVAQIHVIYPFAEPAFGQRRRHPVDGRTRILYAGRLSPEKGIYTLMSTMHVDVIADDPALTFTVTTAGSDKPQGRLIAQLLAAHPRIDTVVARGTPESMSALMAEHDIVVMPSNGQYWHETFGIVSIEAQHAGCRVVASDDGGLPETDCGAVTFVEPDNAEALAWGIRQAIDAGPVAEETRESAAQRFTVIQSVDALLDILSRYGHPPQPQVARELAALAELPTQPRPMPAHSGFLVTP